MNTIYTWWLWSCEGDCVGDMVIVWVGGELRPVTCLDFNNTSVSMFLRGGA